MAQDRGPMARFCEAGNILSVSIMAVNLLTV